MLTLLLLTILQFSAFVALPETAFWDNDDWPSDLTPVHGDGPLLEGTVLFAQSQIMPSKNGIPGDQQPHLTASRKSLVMLRPHTIQNDSVRMEMTVRSRDGTILSGEKPIVMSPPEDIPKHDGWIDLGKLEIDFPSKLDC